MIDKVANNKFNTEKLNLNPPKRIKHKLDFYRSLFGCSHDFSDADFKYLENDLRTFFNIRGLNYTDKPPKSFVRITNNSRIFTSLGKEISYFTEITQLLAPPIQFCNYGRCNLANQQVVYGALNEATAYWEVKPKKNEVITVGHFELKSDHHINCAEIKLRNIEAAAPQTEIEVVFSLLNDFFIDAFSFEVQRDRARDYIFSAIVAGDILFYPIDSTDNIEAFIYPSVQKKRQGINFAIKNDVILKYYNLVGIETRFILDEYENIDPSSNELLTDNLIGSFGTKTFVLNEGKILYNDKVDDIFKLFRNLQINGEKQVRVNNPGDIKTLAFDLSRK